MNSFFLFILIFWETFLFGQELKLELKKEELENFYSMKEDTVKKFGNTMFSIDGRPFYVRYRSHGKSDSYNIHRKSFELKFDKEIKIKNITAKKIILSGSAEDYFMVNNVFSLKVLQKVGLSYVDFNYAMVDLGKKKKKLFVVTSDPVESLMKKNKDVVAVFRTDYNGKMRKKNWAENLSLANESLETRLVNKLRKATSENEVEKIINLNQFLKWVAVNRILRNCDFEDELFFGVINDSFNGQLKIAYLQGWDYEQIACSRPNGESKFNNSDLYFGDQSFWVNIIKTSPFLQQRYKRVLYEMILQHLSSREIDLLVLEIKKDLKGSIKKETILNHVPLEIILKYIDYLGEVIKIETREILKNIWKSNV